MLSIDFETQSNAFYFIPSAIWWDHDYDSWGMLSLTWMMWSIDIDVVGGK